LKSDQIRWNQRYREGPFSSEASGIVKRFSKAAPMGHALDIAAGKGRNSIFLGKMGFEVEALDISQVALAGLQRFERVRPVCADFDSFDIPENRYSLIVNIRFLHRRLFPQIIEGLLPGGVLIFETYMMGPDPAHPGDHNRDYMLRRNELLRAFLPLRILYYREVDAGDDAEEGRPLASLVGVKGGN
jgi:SAM-dependent methyltransferase